MVKGISRRVIVVRSPDPRFFDEAIFLMKEDALNAEGVTADQVVAEARQVAAGYLRRNADGFRRQRMSLKELPGWLYFVLGAGAVGLVWLVLTLI